MTITGTTSTSRTPAPVARRAAIVTSVALVLSLLGGIAWAFWTTGAVPGSSGAAAAATVNRGSTPTLVVSGREVAVDWSATTLSNGDPVSGYVVQRYDAQTLLPQTVGAGCAGAMTATTCTEARVPAGEWVYSVVPTVGTNWRGEPSVRSSPAVVSGADLTLSTTRVRPGASMTGAATGFLPGETLRYRLDSLTGPELPGTLAGNATPAVVPASGDGAVGVTVPTGTADGDHTVYAVAAPSGDAATAAIVVDGTPPPAPVLTVTPTATSGDTVTFAYTEAEASATVECRLDSAAFEACQSPVEYSGLPQGSHTFQVRATDTVGNVGPVTSYTWIVNTTTPVASIGFPVMNAEYNDAGFTAGCGTATTGDVCGGAEDDIQVTGVAVSLLRVSTGRYWNGSGFTSDSEQWLDATGTTSWSYGISPALLPEGQYTLRARATDGANLGYDSRTFTVDRTAPAQPTIVSGPTGTTRGNDTFSFSGASGSTFECRLDAAAWQVCASPTTLSGLATGSHTLDVRAVDQAGNTSTAATRTWTVDATGPTVGTTFPVSGGRYTNIGYDAGCVAGTGDLCGTTADPGSGVAKVEISLQRAGTGLYLTGSTFSSASQSWMVANGTTSWSYPLAASTFPADDIYTLSVRATDTLGNATTTTTTFSIDRTRPTAVGLTTSNAGIVSRLGAGDTFTLTFSEAMAPGSIIAGWTGSTAQNIVVRATGTGGTRDQLTVYNATNTTLLPLGTLDLKRTDYVSAAMTFGATGTTSTLTMSGNSFVITLGTPSGTPTTAAGTANITWTPAAAATDLAGNGAATTAYTETDNDRDF